MKRVCKILFSLFFILIISSLVYSKNKQPDTVLINSWIDSSRVYLNESDYKNAENLLGFALKESKKASYEKGMVWSLLYRGICKLNDTVRIESGKADIDLALKIAERNSDLSLQLKAYKVKGYTCFLLQEWSCSFKYYMKALKIAEKTGNKKEIALCNRQIGVAYISNDHINGSRTGLEYYNKALKIYEEVGDSNEIAGMYYVMGIAYNNLSQLKEGRKCQEELMNFCYREKDFTCVARTQSEIASYYMTIGNNDSALVFLRSAFDLFNRYGGKDEEIINTSLKTISCLILLNRIMEAFPILSKAEELIEKSNFVLYKKAIYDYLAQYHEATGDFKKAYNYRLKQIEQINFINNDKSKGQQEMADLKLDYEKEKKKAELERIEREKMRQKEIAETEKQQQLTIIAGVSLVLAIVIVFSSVLYKKFKLTKRQKTVIEKQEEETKQQKEIIEEKHKEITDSINYAKRLQQAILAPESEIKKYLPESFLLYKPKDIVAGDFYFFEVTDTHIFYAAADCTGHGVPGAMVSIVCSNALTRCVKEFNITDPGKILDKTRELILETFKKSSEEVKDGMDISLLVINRKVNEVKWSGANNPLWYIEEDEMKKIKAYPSIGTPILISSDDKHRLVEVKADKQPIGKSDHPKPFTTHVIPFPVTALFLITDGYADQFGGEKGKKFKYSNLQKLLLENINLEPATLNLKLSETFAAWKGDLEQVDDICIIGIRI